MMDLDEAIQHCKEQVQEQAKKGCYSCAEEHQQLAEWLKELKAYREGAGMKLLIDIPEHIYEHAKESSEDSRDEFDAMRAIANGTQQESRSENPNKWIPVSERLPDESKICLVTYKGGYVGIMCYASDLYRVDEYDFCDEKGKAGWYAYGSEWGHYSRDDVIAWMSLPTPYKSESEVDS